MNVSLRVLRNILAAAAGAALLAAASPAAANGVPPSIAVPAGHELYLVGHARGYQIYRCQAQGEGYAWVLSQPWATLVNDRGQAVALHYAGPSWKGADNSIVVGARIASAPAPVPNAIPWLLLTAVSNSGPPGGTFTNTSYIQRINTTGGLAPASGCDAAHVGATAAVPYTADYLFYRPSSNGG